MSDYKSDFERLEEIRRRLEEIEMEHQKLADTIVRVVTAIGGLIQVGNALIAKDTRTLWEAKVGIANHEIDMLKNAYRAIS